MEQMEIKIKCFEYIVSQFIRWHKDVSSNDDLSSFTKLKLQKLLFLLSAVNATTQNKELLKVFDKFYAMQHGPVESDIYNAMVQNTFDHISFEQRHMMITKQYVQNQEIANYCKLVDAALSKLKQENSSLIICSASSLVDITHKWQSWRSAMDIAAALGKGSELMDINSICSDKKYFRL